MDIGLPPGGLQRIFMQYDAIRSRGNAPPWEPEPQGEAPTRDLRPVGVVMPDITTDVTQAEPKAPTKT